jgi:VIT1/CCC1 family predicted Fe2+/Mn2+ transporter
LVASVNEAHQCYCWRHSRDQQHPKGKTTMSRLHAHPESHLVERIGWLRAAVLGANDGIVSTASLIVGVAAASSSSAPAKAALNGTAAPIIIMQRDQ